MAAHPSLEGIFHILAQIPKERLIAYQRKLRCEPQDRRSAQLLQTMILLTLKRDTEARRSLGALRGDPVAARICATANMADVVASRQPQDDDEEEDTAEVGRIYSLLVDAKLCGPVPRDKAYQADVAGMGGTGKAPMVSDPVAVPVPNSFGPQPLRSTGSPTSIMSHLEISESLTAPFQTHSLHYGTEISKLCGNDDVQDNEERNRDGSLAGKEESSDLKISHCSSSDISVSKVSPKKSVQCPVPAAGTQLPHNSSSCSAEDSSSSKPLSGPKVVPSPDAKEFFTFVVLHAAEDEAIACRVKARLESMGVPDGSTYSEDFLVPGRCELGCFENALDDSAFTLLLLTENFKSRFCAYQTNVALMDSFTRFCKTNTVIPFFPKEKPLEASEMPLVLVGLVSLDENAPVFASRVKKTFRKKDIQEKKAAWTIRRQIRERERLREKDRECQQLLQRLSELGMNVPSAATSPGFYPSPGMPQPPPGPDLPSPCQSFMFSQGFGGAQPPLIIQNAQMVQIGDYNHMQVERTNATLGTGEENGVANPP